MKKIKLMSHKPLTVDCSAVRTSLCLSVFVCLLILSGCVTEYYPATEELHSRGKDGNIRGAVKREGFDPAWSNGVGKNLPLSNPSFSVLGK